MNLILAYSPNVFGTKITWYSIFILTGAIIAFLFTKHFYKKNEESKLHPTLIDDMFFIVFPAGIIGSRIWFVLSEWAYYSKNLLSILKLWEGGLAIQGGVIGGLIAGIIYYKIKKIKFPLVKLFDVILPNLLIAQSIGRWGNFFNREVYGACVERNKLSLIPSFILNNMNINCPIGYVAQPLFLYESILNFLGFILISIVVRQFFKTKTKLKHGDLAAFYLIWYGLIRLIMEPLRNEQYIMRIFGNISFSVVTSVLFIIVGVSFFIYLRIKKEDKKYVEK